MTRQNHKILIYSHDAYGMGNIRRTLAICNYLSANLSNLSILILTGSPVIHTLRIPQNVDYIKLPCLTRDQNEKFSPKFWNMQLQHLIRFRMDLILSAVRSFEPDVVLVDKKPMGIKKEFFPALTYVRECLPNTRVVLGLRDILDDPQVTIPIWEKNRYFSIIEEFYDDVWIYGSPQIFDAVREYRMPAGVAKKVVYTGYLGRPTPAGGRLKIRAELGLNGHLFSLVMAGGGGDGYPLLKAYVDAMHRDHQPLDSLLITGPEMPKSQRQMIERSCHQSLPLQCKEFSDEIEKWMVAADVVLAMGGYNSTCEILSLRKKALIVPRIHPVKEQYIRTKRLAELGLVNMIHPKKLDADRLLPMLRKTAQDQRLVENIEHKIDLNGLQRIEKLTRQILRLHQPMEVAF